MSEAERDEAKAREEREKLIKARHVRVKAEMAAKAKNAPVPAKPPAPAPIKKPAAAKPAAPSTPA